MRSARPPRASPTPSRSSRPALSATENLEAFAIIFDAAGVDWTLSSELAGYDSINYGVWYDDVQFARVALRQSQAAKALGVRKISFGECGHAHKAVIVIADRVLTGDLNIPRESASRCWRRSS